MQIGLQVPNFTWPGGPEQLAPTLARIARRAEEVGFSSFWVMDHLFQIAYVGPAEMDMLEGYTTLGFVAAHTRRMRLGTMVTGVTYRLPGLLIKKVTTLDVLSGGRAWFGVGAAWFEREHRGLGIPFPGTSERFERLEETLQIARQMWSESNGPWRGKHYQLEETLCVPQPLSRPHPPILIGGMGERKTLRLVAEYAQGCNLFAHAGKDVLRHKLEVLAEHCHKAGRDPAEIHKTTLDTLALSRDGRRRTRTPAQVLEHLHELANLGIDEAIFNMPDVHDPAAFDLVAEEIIPALATIQVAGRQGRVG